MTIKPLLAAIAGQKPAHTPIWLMRQAGRYLPEYRALRANHDTLTMFKTPSIAADVTLQPLLRFPLDAAIVYADILLLPDALGLGLSFVAGEGPRFARTIRNEADMQWLAQMASNPKAIVTSLEYVAETLSLVKNRMPKDAALIGFAGAPWTVASYMIEGGSSHGEFFESKKLMFTAPHVLHELLDTVTRLTIDYLLMQVAAGAEVLQLFESWGGALTPDQYAEFAAPYAGRILKALGTSVPTIHFVGEGAGILDIAAREPATVLGIDWRQDLSRASALASQHGKAIQGNLDPLLLHAPRALLEAKAREILIKGTAHPHGFVFNLGHGIRQTTPVENVGVLVDLVHSFGR